MTSPSWDTAPSRGVYLITLASIVARSCAQQYVVVPPSTRHYGQDGPWGAVTVNYGGYPVNRSDSSQWAPYDFLPGGSWTSYILSPESCSDNSTGLCGIAGTTSGDNVDQTYDSGAIDFQPYSTSLGDSGVYMQGLVYEQTMNIGGGSGGVGYTIYNTDTVIVQNLTLMTPSRNTSAVEIGYLALGAGGVVGGAQNQAFEVGGGTRHLPIVAWNLPGSLFNSSIIPTFSYTLQYGSAALQYPLSLIFGGYDMGRIVGAPTTFQTQTSLLDVGIGVQTGGSPFNFTAKSGLLITGSGSNKTIAISPEPLAPYLSLPKQTCDAIAALLPVSFDINSGYYLWQVSDPAYLAIVSSPAYLSFTFPPSPGGANDVVIKVPFKLLNLTLGPIFSGRNVPVPYFPCKPYTPEQDQPYLLGRAFLQAAFLGRNWNTATSWLAQAPGPGQNLQGLGQSYQKLGSDDAVPQSYSGDADEQLNSTWSNYWTPLPLSPTNSANSTLESPTVAQPRRKALSTAALAGISVAAGVVGIALIAGLGLFCWRRRRRPSNSQAELLQFYGQQDWHSDRKDPSPPYSAVDATTKSTPRLTHINMRQPFELSAHQEPLELGDWSSRMSNREFPSR